MLSDLCERTTTAILNRMAALDETSIVWTPRFTVPDGHPSSPSFYYRETAVTLRWETKSRKCDKARQIIAAMPNAPSIKQGYSIAAYLIDTDEIILPDRKYFRSEEDLYATVFHELVHATGHETRLYRALAAAVYGRDQEQLLPPEDVEAEEEIVTEMASAYLCAYAGILDTTIDSTAAYIRDWAACLDPDNRSCPVVDAMPLARKACAYILGCTES